jgi:hypothetical protein
MVVHPPAPDGSFIHDVLPIFLCERGSPGKPLAAMGTGFLIGERLLVTCWHCVPPGPAEGQYYAAVEWVGSGYRPWELTTISQVPGRDIATATVDLVPQVPLRLTRDLAGAGTDVYTFGYPLPSVERRDDGDLKFGIAGRYLQGYVTRGFDHPESAYGVTPAYELDMPAPAGLSGAPLLTQGTADVVGIVFGSNDLETVDSFKRVDPETGETHPEVRRVVSFGLAHHTRTLWDVKGTATGGQTLRDLLLG